MNVSRRAFWTTWVVCTAGFVVSAWPGWLAPDSTSMLRQAERGRFTDWHAPLLSWAWSLLAPKTAGPVLPFLIQAISFWSGLLLVALHLRRRGAWWSVLLFPGSYLLPTMWLPAWLLKDATALCALVLALGLVVFATSAGPRASRAAWAASPLVLAAVVASRWYMAPSVAVAALALGLLAPAAARRSWRRPAAMLGALAVLSAGLLTWERTVVRPRASHVGSSLLVLDLARVECTTGSPEARALGRSLFPRTLLRLAPGHDICEHYDRRIHDPLLDWTDVYGTGPSPTERSFYRMPRSAAEFDRLRSAWVDAARSNPGVLLEARVRQAFNLTLGDAWWSPSTGFAVSLREGIRVGADKTGSGKTVGWPSMGGEVLDAATSLAVLGRLLLLVPVDLGSYGFGFLTLVLLPAMCVALLRHRRRPLRRYALSLAFPLVWLANMAMLAPAYDPRYVAPAGGWSVLVTILVLWERRLDTVADGAVAAVGVEGFEPPTSSL